MFRSTIAAFGLCLTLAVGCSHAPSSTKGTDMSVAGSGSDGGGSAGNDLAGGNGGDGGGNGSGSDGGGGGATKDVFRVLVENYDLNVNGGNDFFASYHYRSTCTRSKIGPCDVLVCGSFTAPMKVPDAGRIDVTGGRIPLVDIADVYGNYQLEMNSAYAWSGGETLTYAAPGGMVPAFDATLVAPPILRLTQPAAAPPTIDRATPWSLQWNPGPAGQFLRATFEQKTATGGVALDCALPLDAGSGAIPAAALQQLSAGKASYIVEAVSKKVLPGATVDTELVAAAWFSDGAGGAYLGDVTMK